jgi:mono/diheme cytochrome c family protein
MYDQPRYEPDEPSVFYADGRSSRPLVAGTVAREQRELDLISENPPEKHTSAQLQRGRERYDIYCSPCHDRAGSGQGVIVQRGFQVPPSFHQERLREASDSYLFQVITRGFGAMYPYGNRISPTDRWAIIGYVRALQLSQNIPVAELSDELRARVEASP